MTAEAKRTLVLIVLGAAAVSLAVIVLVRNRDVDTDLLATIGLIGALAIIINSLPIGNGHKNGNGG
jgi:hypothetical protein